MDKLNEQAVVGEQWLWDESVNRRKYMNTGKRWVDEAVVAEKTWRKW